MVGIHHVGKINQLAHQVVSPGIGPSLAIITENIIDDIIDQEHFFIIGVADKNQPVQQALNRRHQLGKIELIPILQFRIIRIVLIDNIGKAETPVLQQRQELLVDRLDFKLPSVDGRLPA